MFNSIQEVHRYIASYCIKLFEKMDSELTPEVLLDISNEDTIKVDPEIKGDIVYYHTKPIGVSTGYCIFSLAFDSNILSGYHTLNQNDSNSLFNIIIQDIKNYIITLVNSYFNKNTFSEVSVPDFIRKSGKKFLSELLGISYAKCPYGSLNRIAALSYEKNFSTGVIVLANHELFPVLLESCHVKFQTHVPLSRYRHARKLLELSKNKMALLSDGENLCGIISSENEIALKNAYFVEFTSPSSWQLIHNEQKLMHVTYEDVFIPKPKISFYRFNSILKKAFPSMENKKIASLYRLVIEATKQSKGTIIILSKNARSEAYRLRNQGFLIEPLKLTPNIMLPLTSIDGAVMVDLEGVCHGIGVILDGIASEKGDPARGARYNSVIRYVETLSQNGAFSSCLSIVVSEDGDVDIL